MQPAAPANDVTGNQSDDQSILAGGRVATANAQFRACGCQRAPEANRFFFNRAILAALFEAAAPRHCAAVLFFSLQE
jgi:hypothetical protein